jgi:hypothetical protein
MQHLMALKYDGLVLLHDIPLNPEMRRWWKEMKETSNNLDDRHDLTSVGQFSGSGLLDFSHRVQIVGGVGREIVGLRSLESL